MMAIQHTGTHLLDRFRVFPKDLQQVLVQMMEELSEQSIK